MELTLAWKLNWHHYCSRSIGETLRYFLAPKFFFHFWFFGERQQNTDHQYDQRQTWSPKVGEVIDGPCHRSSSQRKCWESQTWKTCHHPSGHGWFCSSGSKLPWGCHNSHIALKKDGSCWQHWGEDVTPNGTDRLYLWVTWTSWCSFQES